MDEFVVDSYSRLLLVSNRFTSLVTFYHLSKRVRSRPRSLEQTWFGGMMWKWNDVVGCDVHACGYAGAGSHVLGAVHIPSYIHTPLARTV
jgi:hypothetical protein